MRKFLIIKRTFFNLLYFLSIANLIVSREVEIKALYDQELGTLKYKGEIYKKVKSATINMNRNFGSMEMLNKKYLYDLHVKDYSSLMKLHPGAVESESEEIAYLSVVIFLTLFAGAMSGLTVGYLSIDDLVLELKSKTGSDVEQECARKILPILNKRHWLLVTLLLWNASAMEALPIFLNKLVGEYFAIIISVTLVLFFGEIIPQALCTGPGQIRIAAFLSPLVNFLMWISAPMSYPIALLLDYLLGKHSKSRFLNTDLKGLIEMHTLEALEKLSQEQGHNLIVDNDELGLRMEQADLMISALEIKQKKAGDIMINLNNIFMLDYDNPLDFNTLQLILEKGYSRIPVYAKDKHNILGILRIKQLIGVDIGKRSIRQLKLKLSPPIVVHPETPALDLLSEFRKGKSHMAFVTANTEEYRKKFEEDSTMRVISLTKLRKTATFERIYGMITLEDLLEKMINIEIIDEDEYARTKVKHQKLGMTKKSKFYKDAITRELAVSLVDDNAERINSIIKNSYNYRPGAKLLLEKDHMGDKNDLKESLL